jgi:acetyl-CoA/propionyl-CoA carboxylase carboxyl transferase subunit
MSKQGRLFVTGPEVIRSVTGEDIDMETLGGADVHGSRSGVVHIVTDDEAQAFNAARDAIGLLADQRSLDQELAGTSPGLGELLPENPSRAYNIQPLIREIIDHDTWLELHPRWAPNMVTGIGRLAARTVGIIANNPLRLGGCLDSTGAEKAARFVRMCDSFGVPLIVLVDVPGYLPGLRQEWEGIVRRGAKLLHAFAEAVVPRITLIVRKAYGGAYVAMNSRALGATSVLAWPGSEVAVMGAEAAVNILHRKRLAALPLEERQELTRALAAEHKRLVGGVEAAQNLGVVDAVIDPALTRAEIAAALLKALPLRGSHSNIPL